MDIHHAMIVRCKPDRLYEALVRAEDLTVWMDAVTEYNSEVTQPEVGAMITFQYGQRALKVEVTRLEAGKQVEWRVVQPMWPGDGMDQVVVWTVIPYESSTLVDFRMTGWSEDDDACPSVSYKWAIFMARLKVYQGDAREFATILPFMKADINPGQ